MSRDDLFSAIEDEPKAIGLAAILDTILVFACDIDHALLLADALGWRLLQTSGSGGSYFTMLEGPAVPHLSSTFQHEPRIVTRSIYACASHRSFYGSVVLALLSGVERSKRLPAEAARYSATGKLPA